MWRVAGLPSCPQHQVVQKVGDFWTEGPRGRRARTLAGVGRLSSPARRGPRLQGLVGALATVEASGAQHASVSSPPSTCRALAGGRGGVLCPLTPPARLGSSSAPTSSPEPWGLGIGRSKGLAWPSGHIQQTPSVPCWALGPAVPWASGSLLPSPGCGVSRGDLVARQDRAAVCCGRPGNGLGVALGWLRAGVRAGGVASEPGEVWARASRGQWVDPRGHPCGHVTRLVLLYIGVGNEGIRPSPKARTSGVPRLTTRTELKEQTQPGPFPAAPGPARNPTDIRALAPFPLNCGRPLGRTAQGQGRGRRAGPPSGRPHSAGPGGPAHSLR